MEHSQKEYIKYRLERSEELFQDANLLAQNKRWRSSVNRLYYSCFHLVNALLFNDGIAAKTHDGLKTKFLQNYIKTNKINAEFGKLYSKLIDWRQESDYSIYVDFQEKDVLPLIQQVDNFRNVIDELIQKN